MPSKGSHCSTENVDCKIYFHFLNFLLPDMAIMKFGHLLLYGIKTFVIDYVSQLHYVPRIELSILSIELSNYRPLASVVALHFPWISLMKSGGTRYCFITFESSSALLLLFNAVGKTTSRFFVRKLFLIHLIKCGGSNSGMISCPGSSVLPAENKIVEQYKI